MAAEYSVEVCDTLKQQVLDAQLHRPMRISRYDGGTELNYDIELIGHPGQAKVRLLVERFVGGGYAGQVYKVKLLQVETADNSPTHLQQGSVYALKILVPASGFARFFRNTLYRVGFQGAFQPQVNPAAARAGALWQKFIRRAAEIKFGDPEAVVNIYATFVDTALGSCGQLCQWVDGRTWQLEVDDRLDLLKLWCKGAQVDTAMLGSSEYRAKRRFMAQFVELLHELGAPEFARQYEWSTCKSQPNVLKRLDTQDDPQAGLVAVDFTAGLTLLPFLPMSPGDFRLIANGLARGSIVQFDRGDLDKLQQFVQAHPDTFADMGDMLDELKANEQIYRNSVPDITGNRTRLIRSGELWRTISRSSVTGWKVRNIIDDNWDARLKSSRVLTALFAVVGIIPFLGKLVRRIWARGDWRRHYAAIFTQSGYFSKAVRAKIAERLIVWHRAGRVGQQRALELAEKPWRFICQAPLAILPAAVHRFCVDAAFRKEKLAYLFIRPFRLYFSSKLREQWLRDMVIEGRKKHILTDEDADVIVSQLNEPYIQRYLVSLVVHLMTLPLTQIVSIIVAWIYYRRTGNEIGAGGILLLFQITPISPGSIARGLYAVGIAIYDRSFKKYNIAVFLSFVKYIGYLAFPIQMAYRYPALARFMAGHWATEAVHIVPVFGERGALLEHGVFGLFYNLPLTIRGRMQRIAEVRASQKPRYQHAAVLAVVATMILATADKSWSLLKGSEAGLWDMWPLMLGIGAGLGVLTTLGCRGASFWKRIIASTVAGAATALLHTAAMTVLGSEAHPAAALLWRALVYASVAAVAAIITELKTPEPGVEGAEF